MLPSLQASVPLHGTFTAYYCADKILKLKAKTVVEELPKMSQARAQQSHFQSHFETFLMSVCSSSEASVYFFPYCLF